MVSLFCPNPVPFQNKKNTTTKKSHSTTTTHITEVHHERPISTRSAYGLDHQRCQAPRSPRHRSWWPRCWACPEELSEGKKNEGWCKILGKPNVISQGFFPVRFLLFQSKKHSHLECCGLWQCLLLWEKWYNYDMALKRFELICHIFLTRKTKKYLIEVFMLNSFVKIPSIEKIKQHHHPLHSSPHYSG